MNQWSALGEGGVLACVVNGADVDDWDPGCSHQWRIGIYVECGLFTVLWISCELEVDRAHKARAATYRNFFAIIVSRRCDEDNVFLDHLFDIVLQHFLREFARVCNC